MNAKETSEKDRNGPHLVDGGGECETEGFTRDRQAGFEPRCTKREIGFDLVSVIAGMSS